LLVLMFNQSEQHFLHLSIIWDQDPVSLVTLRLVIDWTLLATVLALLHTVLTTESLSTKDLWTSMLCSLLLNQTRTSNFTSK
jgi:hypothetical protein